MAVLADFGTSWTKILDTDSGERRIEKTKDLAPFKADLATGHNMQQDNHPERGCIGYFTGHRKSIPRSPLQAVTSWVTWLRRII